MTLFRKQIYIGIFFLLTLITGPFEIDAEENQTQITVRLTEYRFDPSRIILKKGKSAEIIVVNEGTMMHEFITEALKNLEVDVEINGVVAETEGVAEFEIPPKAKVVLRFTPEEPGEFPVSCQAKEPKDHFKSGMVGKLVIQ